MSEAAVAPGRVAVVTGAASGIGLALSRRFAAEGMSVAMADVDEQRLSEAAGSLGEGASVLQVVVDVSSEQSVAAFADEVFERFGTLSVLCNNAGVAPPPKTLWKTPLQDWRWTLDIDLFGVVHGINAFLPRMVEAGQPGHVVNTSSISGILPVAAIGAYSVAKRAVVALSEVLRLTLEQRESPIGVSALCPGDVSTALQESSDRLRPAGPGWREHPRAPDEMTADQIAEAVVTAINEDRFWILPHTSFIEEIERTALELVAAAKAWE